MFKVGDKVVSIKNIDLHSGDKIYHINKYNNYTIIKIYKNYLYFNETLGVFKSEYFISISDYRKNKLNKLCLNQEIK